MVAFEMSANIYKNTIAAAIEKLRHNQLDEAFELILKGMQSDPHAAQPHNLLGIWAELSGCDDKARKHYRAAYALDPTFKPACKNLERICTFIERNEEKRFVFGDEPEKEYDIAKKQGKVS
jgi:Flp pilus assembly protein TadD